MSSWSNLKIELIGVGEQPGTWGNTTNTNLGTAIEEAITGRAQAQIPTNASYPLPYDNSNGSQVFRNLVLNVTSAVNLTGTTDLIIPAIEKQYIVENNTTGTPTNQSIRIKTSAGTGVTIPYGMKAHVFCDGVNTRFADDYVDINGGSIDGTPIGAASASTGAFTTVTATSVTATSATLTAASITGGAVNGTPIGATTASTGAFTTLTATTGTITTGNITTGNITTGNISTLNVGTQTNKATISYTTDAARTLTVPAVAGNRTFAFIDEAQTFSAAQTYTANQTVQADLIFSGNSRKIRGNFIAYDNDGTFFQSTVTNQGTALGIIPNGTADDASLTFYGRTNTEDTNYGGIYFSGGYTASPGFNIYTSAVGTGTATNMNLQTGGFSRIRIAATGEVGINASQAASTSLTVHTGGSRTYSLEANGTVKLTETYGNTVGSNNRYVYIDNTGVIGGLVPSVRAAKTNIVAIEDTSWLMALEPVSYNRRLGNNKTGYTNEFNPVTEYGLIADDAVQVRPEICLFDDDNKVAGINYERLITPMLKEIQMLRAEVNALKEKLSG